MRAGEGGTKKERKDDKEEKERGKGCEYTEFGILSLYHCYHRLKPSNIMKKEKKKRCEKNHNKAFYVRVPFFAATS